MKIGSIAASSAGTISLDFVPQFIYFIAATVPTSFKARVLGDGVIKDLDGNGLDMIKNRGAIGVPTNGYLIQVASGLVREKNFILDITNALASTLDVFGINVFDRGLFYHQTIQNKILANSGKRLTDFLSLGLQGFAATDDLTINYRDGLSQEYDTEELEPVLGLFQNETKDLIDNVQGLIKSIQYTPSSDRTVYLTRLVAASGVLSNEA